MTDAVLLLRRQFRHVPRLTRQTKHRIEPEPPAAAPRVPDGPFTHACKHALDTVGRDERDDGAKAGRPPAVRYLRHLRQ